MISHTQHGGSVLMDYLFKELGEGSQREIVFESILWFETQDLGWYLENKTSHHSQPITTTLLRVLVY
jgi:hypothetical protein